MRLGQVSDAVRLAVGVIRRARAGGGLRFANPPYVLCSSQSREEIMRGLALFVVGSLVGAGLATSFAQSSSPNRGIVGINHVALAVPDIEKAVEHYTKTMGFPE